MKSKLFENHCTYEDMLKQWKEIEEHYSYSHRYLIKNMVVCWFVSLYYNELR